MKYTVISECDKCAGVARFEFDEEPERWHCDPCKEDYGKAGIGLTENLFL
jgi:hypothetical protein|tara:strand:+ start:338 stop:487 length:150 start_codon:yes stop_codon:yes gene_type:complete